MRIAYLLYDDLTLLDFVGFYDPISRLRTQGFLPDLAWHLCGRSATVHDNFGLRLTVDRITPDLSGYDLVYIPGGFGSRPLMNDQQFLDWLRTATAVPYIVSVCTGSLLLGAAGLLKGRRATTHFDAYDTLAPYVSEVVPERIVTDGNVITGGAVATALDLGLHVCELLAGKDAAGAIRSSMSYH
ncbi:Isonitrile hydratase [Neolewinella maritima]|uniref:Isonitrile hydratase n=1 Tax=Neolewinella maritima TaxID=1383882 RepID=A0ABM9B222_9BACT|nr:DJ-1/PfpI family protein [Neolewinella maritima]CAH1001389.1 Isonitrile hydratase [Neolewinella maritima]